MDERRKKLLTLVIEDVIETGEPVGSQFLVESHKLDVSPATVRNWFTELEGEGYIAQPHTSSGRMPTEKGYRLYVDELMVRKPLGKADVEALEQEFASLSERHRQIKAVAKKASDLTSAAVVLGLGDMDTFYTGLSRLFAQPEFRDWNRMVTLGQVLDRLDEVLQLVRLKQFGEPTIFIGHNCPFGPACSSLFLTMQDGTLFGLLGPVRMNYRKSFALLTSLKQTLLPKLYG